MARRTGVGLGLGIAAAVLLGSLVTIHRSALPGAPLPRTPSPSDILHLVDLNAAGPGELALLPGVGPRIARRIVTERRSGGPFVSPSDCASRVRGIGPARLEWWSGRVRCDPAGDRR